MWGASPTGSTGFLTRWPAAFWDTGWAACSMNRPSRPTRGARVCRRVPVGSAEHDWVRGTVVSVRGEWMTVRIDDPGRFANQVDGVSVAAGVTLLSEPRVWVPCL